MKWKTVFLTLIMISSLGTNAFAQFFIEEGKISLDVTPGERIQKSVTIHNTSSEDIQLRVYWEDFEYKAPYDGTKNFLPAGSLSNSMGDWVSFAPREFKLLALSSQKIDYLINVPKDVSGGHYGVLFFEREGEKSQDSYGVNIVTRVGSLFFLESNDKLKKASIDGLSASDNKISGQFANQGSVVLVSTLTYYVMDQGGLVTNRGEVAKLYVPPGHTAPWELKMSEDIKAGRYTLVLNADLEGGDVVVREMEFVRDASGALTVESIGK